MGISIPPRKAHSLVLDGPGCHTALHPSIHPATAVCPLHTSLQPFPGTVGEDETQPPARCIPRTI